MIYILRETHEVPAEVQRRLRVAGGVNRFGEPNYRVVWGWNRLTWIGGRWTDRDPATGGILREVVELREVPKYAPTDRWHVERWCPPELYGSPAQWYERTIEIEGGRAIPALGPYPSRGEYELCFTLARPGGEFLPLTPAIVERIVRLVERSRAAPPQERRAALMLREERAERSYDAWAGDVLDDAAPALHGQAFVTVPRLNPRIHTDKHG